MIVWINTWLCGTPAEVIVAFCTVSAKLSIPSIIFGVDTPFGWPRIAFLIASENCKEIENLNAIPPAFFSMCTHHSNEVRTAGISEGVWDENLESFSSWSSCWYYNVLWTVRDKNYLASITSNLIYNDKNCFQIVQANVIMKSSQ